MPARRWEESEVTTTTMVNGYACSNCTDVSYARKNIDPAHPKDGPFGVYAKDKQPPVVSEGGVEPNAAVRFGGQLQNVQLADSTAAVSRANAGTRLLDMKV